VIRGSIIRDVESRGRLGVYPQLRDLPGQYDFSVKMRKYRCRSGSVMSSAGTYIAWIEVIEPFRVEAILLFQLGYFGGQLG